MRVFVVAVALCSALCAAAPKVEIRVIPRPRVGEAEEEEASPVPLLIPSRAPFPAFEGPFAGKDTLPCFREEREMEPGKAYIFDLCALANATVKAVVDEVVEEVEVDVTGGVLAPSDAKDDDVTAKLDMGPAEEQSKEPDVTILGIFRGWHIDPITLNYKSMIYDDGDECMDSGKKYSMTVELIASSNPESDSKLFGFKSAGMCMFEASLLAYVPEEARVARLGVHTPGVIDITSAESVLPVICGKMKCRYEKIAKSVQDLSAQIRDVQDTLVEEASKTNSLFTNMTLEASKSTLESAAQIVGKSVELFHEIEMLQQSLTNDWFGREEAAKREIAQQEAEDKKRKMEQNVSDATIAAAATVDEQEQVTAES